MYIKFGAALCFNKILKDNNSCEKVDFLNLVKDQCCTKFGGKISLN